MMRYVPFLKYYFLRKYPAEITFFITAACNFCCPHCFTLAKTKTAQPHTELTLDAIERLARSCPPFMRLSLSGGEPFLHPHIADICRLFYTHAQVRFITIPTNASLPEKIAADVTRIAETCPQAIVNISVSVNGLETARDASVGEHNTFPSLLATAHAIHTIKKRFRNVQLTAITTNLASNEQTLPDIYAYALDTLGVDNFTLNIARLDSTDSAAVKPGSLASYIKMTELIKNDVRSSRFSFPGACFFIAKRNLVFDAVSAQLTHKKWQTPCFSGNLRVVIDEVGNVFPCETVQFSPHHEQFSFGNLKDYDYNFKRLFGSKHVRTLQRKIKHMKCFCINECDLETTILFNLRFLPTLILEALKCVWRAHHTLG